MRFAGLVPSQHLQIFRYQDIDHFRQGLCGANVDFVPLAKADIPIGQAVLSLPGCHVHLLHTFPRILHTRLENSHAFVLFSMADRPSAVFNGIDAAPSTLQFASGPTEYRAIERQSGSYAALVFSARIGDRGWPVTNGEFLTIPISRAVELGLRGLVMRLFATASKEPSLLSAPTSGAALADALLEELDLAFDQYLSVKPARKALLHDTLRTLRTIDDLVDGQSSSPIYSAQIAASLGISVRSLSNLMRNANGMSLHGYIRLRRLWTVRRQLLTGRPDQQIKQVALSNGFWHLGDFAARYASRFGELPSSTQAQSRR